MRTWTAHLKPGREPVLLREGWSWGAFLFGPFWLLANRAWAPAAAVLALTLLVATAAPQPAQTILSLALGVLLGLLGRDVVRWSLDRRGYLLAHVLAAHDEDAALGRLLTARTDLVPLYLDRAA